MANPVANAGLDQANKEPYGTITVDGSASSDPDGTVASYQWTQVSGPSVTLSGSGATRTFKAPATLNGTTVVLGLRVTDNQGNQSTQDTVSIVVRKHNEWYLDSGAVWVPYRTVFL